MAPRLIHGLALALPLGLLSACPDPPPAPVHKPRPLYPNAKRSTTKKKKASPPMRRRARSIRTKTPAELKKEICLEVYRARRASLAGLQRVLAAERRGMAKTQDPGHEHHGHAQAKKKAKRRRAEKTKNANKDNNLSSIMARHGESAFMESCQRWELDVIQCLSPRHRQQAGLRCFEILYKLARQRAGARPKARRRR